jgi:Zn-dependent alcohol dehydrogenase
VTRSSNNGRQRGWLTPPSTRSPLCRTCPTCQASINERCWNLRQTQFRQRMDGFHQERKRANSKGAR